MSVVTYTLRLHCANCGDVADYELEKGMRVVSTPCDTCGVRELKRVSDSVERDLEKKMLERLGDEFDLS